MSVRWVYYILWIAPVALQVCLAAIMVRRKLRERFPIFFAYTLFQVLAFPIKFYTYHTNQFHYFYAYWVTGALSVGLGFAVIYEIFREVFRPFEGLRDLGLVLFRWAAFVLVLTAVLMAATSPALANHRILTVILTLERSVRVMQCGLVMLMLLCSAHVGLTWRHQVFGIALGFGLFAAVEVVVITVLGSFGQSVSAMVSLGKSAAYNVSVLLWVRYLAAPEPARLPVSQLGPADRWDFALSGVIHPGANSPSLPLIEHAVDRVLQKTNGKNGDKGPKITNLDV